MQGIGGLSPVGMSTRSPSPSLRLTAGRLTISGIWPTDARGYPHTPQYPYGESITVSLDKSPEQIARDLTRRFLPAYLPLWEEQKRKAKDSDKYVAEKARALARIDAALPESCRYVQGGLSVWVGEVETKTVTLKLTWLPFDLAEQICHLLRSYAESHNEHGPTDEGVREAGRCGQE